MKLKYIQSALKWISGASALLLMPFVSSCESVYDDQGDCDPHYYLKFVYDMNMLTNVNNKIGADAFSSQVGSVEVHIFNKETGEYVGRYADQGEALSQPGYRMPLDIAPGDYDIIAWCGLADNADHFKLTSPSVTQHSDLKVKMHRDYDGEKAYNDFNLNPLFHGTLSVSLPEEEGNYEYTVYLTKDTNYIELALQHRSGAIDPDRFTISMIDDNGHLGHDNALLEDEPVEFRPWLVSGGEVDMDLGSRADGDSQSGTGFLLAELATSRLMVNHNPKLTVTDNETGNTVFSIPMVEWALLFKSARHSAMGDQEYLDREYEYNVMVILENDETVNEGWIAAEIVINGWHVVNNGNVGL